MERVRAPRSGEPGKSAIFLACADAQTGALLPKELPWTVRLPFSLPRSP